MNLISIWKYFQYVMKHKYYVYIECRKLGLEFWQSVIHDMSKLRPQEFIPYMNKFVKNINTPEAQRAYDLAWLHHIHSNKHHWQFWLLYSDLNGITCLRMPEKYVKEMVAD